MAEKSTVQVNEILPQEINRLRKGLGLEWSRAISESINMLYFMTELCCKYGFGDASEESTYNKIEEALIEYAEKHAHDNDILMEPGIEVDVI